MTAAPDRAAPRALPMSTPGLILTVRSSQPAGVDDVAMALDLARCHDVRPCVVDTEDGAAYARFRFAARVPVEQVRTHLTAVLDPPPAPGGALLRWRLLTPPVRILVLVSRQPHCLDALTDAQARGELANGQIVGVAGNHADLADRAETAELPFDDLPHTDSPERAARRLRALVAQRQADLVVLARYMRIVPTAALGDTPMINIHHSYLPAFHGGRAHHQARRRGVKLVGATAHYVTAELDEGPIIDQAVRPITVPAPTVADYAAAGVQAEQQALLSAVRLHCAGRVVVADDATTVIIPDVTTPFPETRTA